MRSRNSEGLTLDTGALIALERGDPRLRALLRRATEHALMIAVPSGVVAQAWRGGARQARIAALLNDPRVEVTALDDLTARAVGITCGRTGTSDIVDAHVALVARQRSHAVVTTDPDNVARLDPSLHIIAL